MYAFPTENGGAVYSDATCAGAASDGQSACAPAAGQTAYSTVPSKHIEVGDEPGTRIF